MEPATLPPRHATQAEAPVFKRILLPIDDDSDLSQQGLSFGLMLARLCDARLVALHAIPPFNSLASAAELLVATEVEYCDQAIKDSAERLERVKRMANAAQIACECHHSFGEHPHEAILSAASEHRCDLIVMASHGRHGLEKLLLGSETQKVLSASAIPVLVCR